MAQLYRLTHSARVVMSLFLALFLSMIALSSGYHGNKKSRANA